MSGSNPWTDGNALAGHAHDLFRVDLTAAVGRCTGCGRTAPMTEARVFDHAPGVVARCPVCDQVLLRLVHGPGRAWMDLRGLGLAAASRIGRDLSHPTRGDEMDQARARALLTASEPGSSGSCRPTAANWKGPSSAM